MRTMRLGRLAVMVGGMMLGLGETAAAQHPGAAAESRLAAVAASLDASLQGLRSFAMSDEAEFAERPRAPWSAQDPADSLYRLARAAMDDGRFTRAAELFNRIHERYPASTYAADAYYWQAFALYRTEQDGNLRQALRLIDVQKAKHPKATTRSDAMSLATRIRGELARQGDANSAEAIAAQAATAARSASGASSASSASSPSGASCDDENDDRVEALNALLQMDSERALPILRKVLTRRDRCSVVLRRKAIFLVSQKRSTETEDILLAALKDDPDREVREQAVFWLSQVPTDKALDALTNILRTSNDIEIQKKALFALSQHRSDRGLESLRELASRAGAPRELRADAIFWLGQKRRSESADFLKQLYAKLDDEELKDKVIFSLSQMRGVGSEEWMMHLATNPKESTEMRKKALFWAGQNKSTSIEQLTGLYSRMTDREMREQLIFVYSQRKDTKAVDKLLDIAKNEQDRELRKKAIFWLSQSRDPRAAQFLEDLIQKP